MCQTGQPLLPSVPTLAGTGARGGETPFTFGPGELLDMGADQGKRTVLATGRVGSYRTGLVLFRAAVAPDDSGPFVQPWDGSQPARRLDLRTIRGSRGERHRSVSWRTTD